MPAVPGAGWAIGEVTAVEVAREHDGTGVRHRLVLRRRAGEPLTFPPRGYVGAAADVERAAEAVRGFLAAGPLPGGARRGMRV